MQPPPPHFPPNYGGQLSFRLAPDARARNGHACIRVAARRIRVGITNWKTNRNLQRGERILVYALGFEGQIVHW